MSRSNIPSAWRKRASNPRWAASATLMTMPWPRPSMVFTKPRSFTGAGRGAHSRPSSSLLWNGSIGSTTGGSWSPSETSRRPKPRNATTPCSSSQTWRRGSNKMASDKPGAVHADIHAHGIIHRDIKRQNMKFDSEGCLKIFDFGLARYDSISPSTIGAIGTVGYMAPEPFSATSEGKVHFTKAIDTYAYGATLLAFSHGKLTKKMRSTPPRIPCAEANFKRLAFPLPKEIAETLNDCISPAKEARPDMDEVAQRLGLYI